MKALRIKTNEIELQIRDNELSKPAVMFLHFSGANLMMWQRVVPHVQDHYRLILVDLRGHGKSEQPKGGYHMDEMARDILGLMHHLDLERVHVVGSSLGAEVGLSLAAHYPEKVTSLVCDGALASAYGPYGTWEGTEAEYEEHVARQLARIEQAPEVVYPSVDALVQAQREVFERYGWWNAYLEAVVRYGVRQVGPDKYVKSFGKQANAAYMEHYYRYRFEDYYRRVSSPILMLAEKEGEDARERAAMRGLKALAAQAEIAEIDGWAHPYCWLLEPEPAVKKVLEFLGK